MFSLGARQLRGVPVLISRQFEWLPSSLSLGARQLRANSRNYGHYGDGDIYENDCDLHHGSSDDDWDISHDHRNDRHFDVYHDNSDKRGI